MATAPRWEDPFGAAGFLRGEQPSPCPCGGFPVTRGSPAGCPEPRTLQAQPVRQHVAPCVITMVFTTLTPLRVFIITVITPEFQSRSILCKSGMPGSANESVTPLPSKKPPSPWRDTPRVPRGK